MCHLNKRRQATAIPMIATVAALAVAACSSKSTNMDAGSDTAVETGGTNDTGGTMDTGGADLAPQSCDPFAQNCGTGQKCDFFCQGSAAVLACEASTGTGAVGSPCSASMPCAAGNGCFATSTLPEACRKYCMSDGDCATGERCHNVTVGVACTGGTTSFALHFCY